MTKLNQYQNKQSGFTLLELLVALSIFALISVMAYAGLNTVLDARIVLEQNMDRLGQIQKSVQFITRDISHIVDRQIRDEYGDNKAAVLGSELNIGLGSPAIEMTRTGYPNPMNMTRSHLQRVAYRLQENVLYREAWQVIDRAPDSTAYQAKLCDNVTSIKFRYLDNESNWHDQWPPSNPQYQGPALPSAVEFALELKDWGSINRLLPLIEVS
ncbi:MAG: type II secretion system minor pseudopilin GspJ [Gammaproteobacteria bacterium]|nr:type II secretion system minor pseudopilin GspJ [Gammaproteobacteria bacterium]